MFCISEVDGCYALRYMGGLMWVKCFKYAKICTKNDDSRNKNSSPYLYYSGPIFFNEKPLSSKQKSKKLSFLKLPCKFAKFLNIQLSQLFFTARCSISLSHYTLLYFFLSYINPRSFQKRQNQIFSI